jgi:hypothetical protein
VSELGQLRFDWTGALLFATKAHGVMKLASCALTTPSACPVSASTVISTDAAGSGVSHAADGAVLYTDGNAVERSPSVTGFPVSVLAPVAIDVVTGGLASAFPALPTGAVCAAAGHALPCHSKSATSLSPLYTFPSIDRPQGWGFAKDDTAWVATSVNPTMTLTAGQAPHNGLLWRVTASGATIVYPTRINGPQPPIVGVALPATSKVVTETTATDTHSFVVGADVFIVTTPLPCRLALTVFERLPSQVQPCLNSTGLSLTPATYLGESFPTEYDVQPIGTQSCFSAGSEATEVTTAFFPAGNLASIRRPVGAPQGNNKCVENTLAQWALAAPNDAGTKTGSLNFSGFMGALTAPSAQVANLQLLSPLQSASFVTTDPTQAQIDAAVEQNLGNVAVKFALSLNGAAVTTQNAVFSVQRLGSIDASGQLQPDSVLCDVQPQDAVTGPPKFFVAGGHHRFNLDTSQMSPVACTQAGLYAFGISFPIDGKAAPVTFLVQFK